MSLENLEPSLYLDPNKSGIPNVSIGRYGVTDESLNSSSAFQRLSISRGSREEGNVMGNEALSFESRQHSYRIPSSDSDVSGHSSRETTAVDAEDNGTVEPYAKQIYMALMSVSNHSMVLQEIYQWFRENTTRGSSDSKGWMNSIRHNLSMNAVSLSQPKTCQAMLTINRRSRKRSEKFPVMKQKSPLSGFLKTSQSKMVCNPPLDTGKETG